MLWTPFTFILSPYAMKLLELNVKVYKLPMIARMPVHPAAAWPTNIEAWWVANSGVRRRIVTVVCLHVRVRLVSRLVYRAVRVCKYHYAFFILTDH